jgi:glyoxalase family protein
MTETPTTDGIHHVTAVVGDPARNAEFYVDRLGLRLLKRTVNHDDRYTYHLYYGDGEGTPGTAMTVFPWGEGARAGRRGTGQVVTTAFAVPEGSLEYWAERLADREPDRRERFGESVLRFEDPDGLELELVETDALAGTPWAESPVPEKHQVRGLYGVCLSVADSEPTVDLLAALGYEAAGEEGDRRRLAATGPTGAVVDLVETDLPRGQGGVGTVHHVAFRVESEDQDDLRTALSSRGLQPTEAIDRKYFRSVYCREPGGVLYEFATPEPGFTVDEPVDELGSSLVLPDWLEDDREEIETRLPDLETPVVEGPAGD